MYWLFRLNLYHKSREFDTQNFNRYHKKYDGIYRGDSMTTVTVSPKFQVVIPKDIRNRMELKPGQKFQVLNYGDRIEFVPIKNIKKLKGFLKGIDTTIEREKDRI